MEKLYFLARPDQWYIDRINRVLNDEARRFVINALKSKSGVDINKGMVAPYIREGYGTFFSGNYIRFEKLIKSDLFVARDGLPSEEEVADFFDMGKELFKFVEAIKRRADLDFNEISDSELDRLFIEAYKEKERFTTLCLDFSRATIKLLKPSTEEGAFPEEELSQLERRLKFDECTLPYINRHALQNL